MDRQQKHFEQENKPNLNGIGTRNSQRQRYSNFLEGIINKGKVFKQKRHFGTGKDQTCELADQGLPSIKREKVSEREVDLRQYIASAARPPETRHRRGLQRCLHATGACQIRSSRLKWRVHCNKTSHRMRNLPVQRGSEEEAAN